jgi:hypothetical protein
MPDCGFSITPASQGVIAKKGDLVQFKMNPPNRVCSISCSSSGDIEVVQCGGDGSATVRATTDNATGTLFITKTCKAAVPEEGIVACGPTTVAARIGPAPRNDAKLIWIWIIFFICLGAGYLAGGLLGGLVGMAYGAPLGGLLGFAIGMVISWIFDP